MYHDRLTGTTVRQLTDYRAHSYHPYFTNPGWWDGGRHLLFGSDRGNATNLYSIELATGEITPITDNPPAEEHDYHGVTLNPHREEAYLARQHRMLAIDLRTGTTTTLAEAVSGWTFGSANAGSDGRFVYASMMQTPSVGEVDLGHGYLGFREIFEAHPLCRVVRVPVDGGPVETLHEERNWIGHVNTSPTNPRHLTFCHEGPWRDVQQRLWALDAETGRAWKLRPQAPEEGVGHEYWLADGERIAYQVLGDGTTGTFGVVRHDGTIETEVPFPTDSHHVHSNDADLIVADGPEKGRTPYVLLCRRGADGYDGPRVLCIHRGSRHTQHLHVHPRFSPDGSQVLFTADPRGYGQLFLANVPPFEELPRLADVPLKA